MTKDDIRQLSEKVASGTANEDEILIYNRLLNSFAYSDFEWDESIHGNKKEIEILLKESIHKKIDTNTVLIPVKWARWAVSAAAVLLIGFASYTVFEGTHQKAISGKIPEQKQLLKRGPSPGGEKAILTLSDGSIIILDSAQNGTIAKQGNTKVIKLNGKLAYDPAMAGKAEIAYNVIHTPRGGTYQIELSDGSRVWMNAASSLRFPTAFSASQREVELEGEAYFEIAKVNGSPFIVKVNNSKVEVQGTHFNIMAYNDELLLKTTLLEGAVKFTNGNKNILLKPGQQSQWSANGHLQLINDVDLFDVTAWKEGLFHFENANLETVLKQLSRWYDVDIIYETNKTEDLFFIEMPRSSKLSDVLKVIELSAGIHCEIDGKKIKVRA